MKKANMHKKEERLRKNLLLFVVTFVVCLFISGHAWADQFGVLSETYVYPDGLRIDVDSKLFVWNGTLATSDDASDKREGEISFKGVVGTQNWFGLGIVWDSNNDNAPDPKNMSAYMNGSLNFWVKTNIPLQVGIEGAGRVQKWVYLNVPTDNQWRFVSIPFSQFSTSSSFFAQTYSFFMVLNNGLAPEGHNFHFDNVRWNTANVGALHHIAVTPSPWTVHTGLPKSFLAKGYDASNNISDIYPTWSRSGVNGTFLDSNGPLCIFKPTSTSGSGSIAAAFSGKSASASVQAQQGVWNDLFNIFIDEGLYGTIGTYDADGTGTNNTITLDTIINTQAPADKKLKATYSITTAGWAGVFIQEGALTDTTSVKNLSRFEDGYIHFYVYTPVDLEIGVRTNNISAGSEKSKVMLSEYGIPANRTWQEAYIPLNDFKLRDERLNFTQSKVFVNIAVVGEKVSDYSDIFWLADIKYVRHKTATANISVNIKRRSDNQIEPSGQISFSSAQLKGGWEIADQYFEVTYDTPHTSWGAQIYTDNMGTGASPEYTGDPTEFLNQQPAGLIGEAEPFLTCPMAWMVLDGVNTSVPVPVGKANQYPPNDPRFGISFKSDTSGMWGPVPAESEWLWLKDKSSTKWGADTNGNGQAEPSEIVSSFSTTGDLYSTFLNPAGLSTGWGDVDAGSRVYILNPEPPIVMYAAAKFENATVLQRYKTNTLTMELYHY